MKKLNYNSAFIWPYVLFLLVGSILITYFSKGYMLIWINDLHSPFLDRFFYLITQLGHGLVFIALIIFLAFIKWRYAFAAAGVYLITGFLVQVLKYISDQPRPLAFYGNLDGFHVVDSITLYSAHGFPSGHTATAFAMGAVLSMIMTKSIYGMIFFMVGFVVAISRVYLLQHFYIDVLVGSLIGMVVAHWVYSFLQSPFFDRIKWIDGSLIIKKSK